MRKTRSKKYTQKGGGASYGAGAGLGLLLLAALAVVTMQLVRAVR